MWEYYTSNPAAWAVDSKGDEPVAVRGNRRSCWPDTHMSKDHCPIVKQTLLNSAQQVEQILYWHRSEKFWFISLQHVCFNLCCLQLESNHNNQTHALIINVHVYIERLSLMVASEVVGFIIASIYFRWKQHNMMFRWSSACFYSSRTR